MNRFKLSLVSILTTAMGFLLIGCSAIPLQTYALSADNIALARTGGRAVDVLEFTGDQRDVSCRAQEISPDRGRTFAQYIRDALRSDLLVAGVQGTSAPIGLSAKLINVDVDCNSSEPAWRIELAVSVNQRPAFSVKVVRTFDWNFLGEIVFERAVQAYVPAIQDTVSAILSHPSVRQAREQ